MTREDYLQRQRDLVDGMSLEGDVSSKDAHGSRVYRKRERSFGRDTRVGR